MNGRVKAGTLLRFVDPISLYPGIRVFDKSSHRKGEIVKIENYGRGLPEIYIVFNHSDTPVSIDAHPDLIIVED